MYDLSFSTDDTLTLIVCFGLLMCTRLNKFHQVKVVPPIFLNQKDKGCVLEMILHCHARMAFAPNKILSKLILNT
jgi:hypothetical protein